MDKSSIIIATLILYNFFLILVGWSTRKKNKTIEDYFVGGKRLGPVITSISYSASNSSAWTLLGVSGIAFSEGISTLWLVIGVVGGMFISWLKVAPSIYDITKKKNFITIPQLISDGYKETERKNILTTASFIIIFSFTFYIASQFQGAGNALNDTFGLSIFESIILSAFIIYIYTYLGGYLAVSITDTIQGFLMAFTAIVMPLMAISKIGGFAGLFEKLSTASGDFLSFSAGNVGLSALGLIVGHLGIGMGYFGQPHLLSRFISVKDLKTLEKSRNYALIWFCIVFTGMWLLGIAGHFMITDLSNNENICDIEVISTNLNGCELGPEVADLMIDEYPILAVAAAFAEGTTIMLGLKELRVKESDRLSAISKGLIACGVKVEETIDSLTVYGKGGSVKGGAFIEANMDHRIAMSFLVLGMATEKPIEIDDSTTIQTSFPNFYELMTQIGCKLTMPSSIK